MTKDSGATIVDSGHGGTNDGGTVVFVDSGTTTFDAGVTPPADPGIFCGTDAVSNDPVYCTGSDICCVSGEQAGSPTYACSSEGACTGGGISPITGPNLVVPCDDTEQCGKRICCGTFVTGNTATPSYYSQVRCAATCTGTEARIFCDPANGNAECTGTDVCEASGALPGFNVCGQP